MSPMLAVDSWRLLEREVVNDVDPAETRPAALNLFVVVKVFYLFSGRSLSRSAWRIGMISSRWIIVGVTVQVIGQSAIACLPAMNTIFDTAPIGVGVWLRVLTVAVGASLVVMVDKRLRRGHA